MNFIKKNFYSLFFLFSLSSSANAQSLCTHIQFLLTKDFVKTDNAIGDSIFALEYPKEAERLAKAKNKKQKEKILEELAPILATIPKNINYQLWKNLPSSIEKCSTEKQFEQNAQIKELRTCEPLKSVDQCLKQSTPSIDQRKRFFKFISGIEDHLYTKNAQKNVSYYFEWASMLTTPSAANCAQKISEEFPQLYKKSEESKTPASFRPQWTLDWQKEICSDATNWPADFNCLKLAIETEVLHWPTLGDGIEEASPLFKKLCRFEQKENVFICLKARKDKIVSITNTSLRLEEEKKALKECMEKSTLQDGPEKQSKPSGPTKSI